MVKNSESSKNHISGIKNYPCWVRILTNKETLSKGDEYILIKVIVTLGKGCVGSVLLGLQENPATGVLLETSQL